MSAADPIGPEFADLAALDLPGFPERGQRSAGHLSHRDVVLASRVVRLASGALVALSVRATAQRVKHRRWAFQSAWYSPEERERRGGMTLWLITYVVTSSPTTAHGWISGMQRIVGLDDTALARITEERIARARGGT